MSAQTEVAASRYLYRPGRRPGLACRSRPRPSSRPGTSTSTTPGPGGPAVRPIPWSSFTPLLGYDVKTDGARPPAGPGARRRFPPVRPRTRPRRRPPLATGYKTDSGNISWLPGDPRRRRPDDDRRGLQGAPGAAIGVVSTVPFDHATPAAFVSHQSQPQHLLHRAQGLQGPRARPTRSSCGPNPMSSSPAARRSSTIPASIPRRATSRKPSTGPSRPRPNMCSSSARPGRRRRPGPGRGRGPAASEGPPAVRALRRQGRQLRRPAGRGFARAPAQSSRRPSENPSLAEATVAALDCPRPGPRRLLPGRRAGRHRLGQSRQRLRGHDRHAWPTSTARSRRPWPTSTGPGDGLDWSNTALIVTADHATGGLLAGPRRSPSAWATCRPRSRASRSEEPPARTGSDRGNGDEGPRLKSPEYASPFVYPDGEVSYGTAGHTNELVNLAAAGAASRETS
ncbi:MAG: hypothetical protein MZW92_10115 [Comamonadaceae bacterium]|nr:hypothetical protein [Comamonadaceae bacterium]